MWINPSRHVPVLRAEAVAALAPLKGGCYVDATFGGGGYADTILEAADCRLYGLDRDPEAAARGAELAARNSRFVMLEGRFSELTRLLAADGVDAVDGVVADLGVSSFQLDDAGRGFSFRGDGPLDMRMGRSGRTAADLVNEASESELIELLFRLGEEPRARRIARAIVTRRATKPFATTAELQAVVANAKGGGKPGRDPATQTFQAVRMAVNQELEELESLLASCLKLLRPGGRLVVVTFHSLEDRLVKRFVDEAGGSQAGPSRHLPETGHKPRLLRWVRRRVAKPSADEIAHNPRARSAKLRAAERTDEERAESDQAVAADLWRLAA